MKKFEMTSEFVTNIFGEKLFRIKALVSFGNVSAGDLGGYIQKEGNLDHSGNAWVCGDAQVCGNAWVYGNAQVYGDAQVSGNARVCGDAQVCGNAWVYGNARVSGDAQVCGNARVCGEARVSGDAQVCGDADYACVKGFGRENRNTTFFRTKNNEIFVNCGCFSGNLNEFRKKVKETHRESKMAQEYLMIADLMQLHFVED